MSIDRPRRIFRGSARSASGKIHRIISAASLGALAVGVVVVAGTSSNLFGRPPPPLGVISARAEQVAVVSGDVLRVAGQEVRLSDVSAPPPGQACGAGADCNSRASAALAGLVLDHAVQCRIDGHDLEGRPAAYCLADGININVMMVSIGWVHAKAEALRAAENAARAARRGLWIYG